VKLTPKIVLQQLVTGPLSSTALHFTVTVWDVSASLQFCREN